MMPDLLDGPAGASLKVPCDLSTDAVEAAIQVVYRLDRHARRHGCAPTTAQLLRALRTDLHGRYTARSEGPMNTLEETHRATLTAGGPRG